MGRNLGLVVVVSGGRGVSWKCLSVVVVEESSSTPSSSILLTGALQIKDRIKQRIQQGRPFLLVFTFLHIYLRKKN